MLDFRKMLCTYYLNDPFIVSLENYVNPFKTGVPITKKQLIDLQGKSIDWFLYVMTIDFKDTKEQLQKKRNIN